MKSNKQPAATMSATASKTKIYSARSHTKKQRFNEKPKGPGADNLSPKKRVIVSRVIKKAAKVAGPKSSFKKRAFGKHQGTPIQMAIH
jgi:hypothetical protein